MALTCTLAGSVVAGGSANPLTIPAYNQVAGNCAVICTSTYINTVSSVADTAGNVWVPLYAGSGYAGANTMTLQIWYAKNCKGNAANVITITYSGAPSFSAAFYYDIAGADISTPLDATIAGAQNVLRSSIFSTQHPKEAVIFLATSVGSALTWSAGNLYPQLATSVLTSGTIPASFTALSGTWASDATEGAYATANDANTCAVLYDNVQTWTNDQYAEGTLAAATDGTSSSGCVGPAVRISTSADTFYMFTNYAGNLVLLKVVAGSATAITFGAHAYSQNNVYRMEVIGNTFKLYINGVLLSTFTDSSSPITTGKAGLASRGVGTSTTRTLKNWSAGSMVSAGLFTADIPAETHFAAEHQIINSAFTGFGTYPVSQTTPISLVGATFAASLVTNNNGLMMMGCGI